MKKYKLLGFYLNINISLLVPLVFLFISSSLLCSANGQDFESDWSTCTSSTRNGRETVTCEKINTIPIATNTKYKDVQILLLENNNISKLESNEFENAELIHLYSISLRNNIIRHVERDAFEGLKSLKYLDLSGNKIEMIDPDVFAALVSLSELKLGENPLRQFSNLKAKMPSLTNLISLDLSGCQFTSLQPGLFDNLKNLQTLDLSGNKIQQIPLEVIYPLTRLNNLNLAKNPWKCDCRIRDFHKWVVGKKLALKTFCDGRKDKSWEHMTPDDFFCTPDITFLRIHVDKQIYETDVTQTEGSEVIFECEVDADPSPYIIWKKDDKVLFNTTEYTDLKTDKYDVVTLGTSLNALSRGSNLTVKSVTKSDEGLYTCRGANIGAAVERTIRLDVNVVAIGGHFPSKNWLWILLGVLGFLILLVALLLLVFCCFRRRQDKRKTSRVADVKNEQLFEKKPVKDETENAVSTPLLQQPDVVLAKERYVGAGEDQPDSHIPNVNAASRPMLPLIYGHQPRLTTTPAFLSNSQILIPHQFDHPYGGWASYDPRRAPNNQVSLNYGPPGPYGRLHSPFSGSVASFTSEPAPRVPPGLGYVTLPRRRRLPSWSPAPGYPRHQGPIPPSPTGSLPIPTFRMRYQPSGPRYDTIGPRTTADGGSNLSLNTIGRSQNPPPLGRTPTGYTTPMTPSTPSSGIIPRNAYTPMTPLSGRITKPGSNMQNYMMMPSSHFNFDPIQENEGPSTPISAPHDNVWSHDNGMNSSGVEVHTSPLQNPLYSSDLDQKIPPIPPAKPKRKSMNLEEQDVPNIANIPGTEV